jgi:hypothetical protein
MSRATHRWSLVALLCCSVGACKQHEPRAASETEPQAEPHAAIEAAPKQPEPAIEPTAPEPTTPEPAPPPVVEPAPAVPVEPGTVPIAEVAPTKVTAPWRELASPSEPLTFIYLAGGVLARSPSGYHDLAEDGSLVLRSEIEPPSQPDNPRLLGYWPTDVWDVRRKEYTLLVDPRGDEYFATALRVSKLRENYRWVVQKFQGDEEFQEVEIRKGWKGGLLVLENDELVRLAGGAADPESGLFKGDILSTFVETRSGEIYTISQTGDALWVQRDCQDEDQACVDANAKQLPFGPNWSFAIQVPRQRHSVTLTATCGGDMTKEFLLHYEKGGWKLETMPALTRGLWPSKDGGLWVLLDSALWHRDPDGGWRNIAVPEGAQSISAAMLLDQSELWIAALIGGAPKVFATHTNAQEPPPVAPEITVQTG